MIKKIFTYLAAFSSVTLFVSHVWAGQGQMIIKDLDEMTEYVTEQIKLSKSGPEESRVVLQKAFVTIFSRPDDDGMIDKIIGPLRSEIEEVSTWEEVVSSSTQDAIAFLKKPTGKKGSEQVERAFFLQNIISYLKPQTKKDGWERKLVQKIADADLETTKEARDYRGLNLIKDRETPSEIAQKALRPEGKK